MWKRFSEFFKENKKVFLISIGLIFVVLMIFLKSSSSFKNDTERQEAGLIYNKQTVGDLVNRDTDGDGVPDWQEILWGTDPTKQQTIDGIPDKDEIQKLKATGEVETDTSQSNTSDKPGSSTSTTEFSKQLFSTVASLTETGGVDQNTVDTLTDSLAQQINNPVIKKVYITSDIKISNDNSSQAIKNYGSTLAALFNKYPSVYNQGVVTPIAQTLAQAMQAYLENGNDAHALTTLDPTIKNLNSLISSLTKTTVPNNLSSAHLEVLNGFEVINENLNDIQQTDIDPVVTVAAGNNFSKNIANLQASIDKLRTGINAGLQN